MPKVLAAKTAVLLFLILNGYAHCVAESLSDVISKIEKELSMVVVYDQIVVDSWSSVTYEKCDDSLATFNYVQLLYREFSKYPKNYFQLAGIKKIVLGKQLAFAGQNRAGIPDPYINALFLAIDGAYGDSSLTYLIHVMHHELNHCTEYAVWKTMYYKWNEWSESNPRSFQYKSGGASAYEDLSTDWYSMTHPQRGFLNLYSTTGEEEDRSELIAVIMSDEERKYIEQYYHEDEVLRQKVQLIMNHLDKFSQTTDNYWQTSMRDLVNFK